MTDKEEIIRALSFWFKPGDVFEIRALGATSSGNRQEHTVSGYFDFEHIKDAAEAVCKLYGFRGVYATANPVKPDLLARAVNRIRPIGRNEPTTSDGDIARRKWLLIDCDADRPAGISSTDAEHEAALTKIREIRDGLSTLGWPQPLMTDSGNGAQLMYAIDLPADDSGLVQKCLESLSAASDENVHVDKTVCNPARIWRLPGTMNCKGDHAEGFRPHRMARILEVPEEIITVTGEQLRTLTEGIQEDIPAETAYLAEGESFDLDAWIAAHCPEVGPAQPYKDGRKWIFPVCPFNSEHTNRSAALFQNAAGAIGFRCLHNSCMGNDWRKLRVMLEPGCYDHREENFPEVDISGLLGKPIEPAVRLADPAMMMPKGNRSAPISPTEQSSDATDDRTVLTAVPFPEELFSVPGLVSDVMQFCLDTAPSPNRMTAFVGALALQAHLAARKVQAPGGARTNPYLVVLAKSGYGKDHPRKINRAVLRALNRSKEVIDSVASGQALEDRLLVTPAILWQSDEFYAVLLEVVNDKTGQKENLMKTLLTLFTSANVEYEVRAKVGRDPATINCPNLVLMGSCTPGNFSKTMNDGLLAHGMYSRMAVFPVPKIGGVNLPKDFSVIPEHIIARAKKWVDYVPPGSGNMDFKARTLYAAEPTIHRMLQIMLEARARLDALDKAGAEDWILSIWTRAFESIMRFSLIYACSKATSPEEAVLDMDALEWARKLVFWEAENKIAFTEQNYYQSDFERYSEEVINILALWKRANDDKPMPGWKFNRRTKKLPPKVLNAVLQSLTLQERISVEQINSNGKTGLAYSLKR